MDRYSFTGTGNILLRAGAAGVYGNKSYEANEPIAYYTKVVVDISFSNIEKIARTGTSNLLADSKSEPSLLRVYNIVNTESLQSLLYKKENSTLHNKTESRELNSVGGVMFLPIETDDVLIPSSVFIYDTNKVKKSFTIGINDEILGLADGLYKVFYSIEKTALATYSLATPQMAYMSAEISVLGNFNGTTGTMVLNINKLKLLSKPTMNFNNSTPFVDSLEFAILSDNETPEVNYYGA